MAKKEASLQNIPENTPHLKDTFMALHISIYIK